MKCPIHKREYADCGRLSHKKKPNQECKVCGDMTKCIYNINFIATPICENCGRAIAKQEIDYLFKAH